MANTKHGFNRKQFENILNKNKTERELYKELEKEIGTSGRVSVSFDKVHKGYIMDGEVFHSKYIELLKNKTLKDDQKLMEDIIKYRKYVIQHRISGEVSLFLDSGDTCSFTMYKCLFQHMVDISSYWLGTTVDPSSFPSQVHEFGSILAPQGVGSVTVGTAPIKKGAVSSYSVVFYFA